LIKLLASLGFILIVVSFGRYSLIPMIPMVFCPTVVMALSETPYGLLLKRCALALPFCLLAGISNLVLDTGTALTLGSLSISTGLFSFLTLLFKAYLSVITVLLLVATTPIHVISEAMQRLKIPSLMITLFEMTYRYLGTLLEEASAMALAYGLRSRQQKGIELRHMGSFVGQLLLRSFDRAERIYQAMKLRGYPAAHLSPTERKVSSRDILYLVLVLGSSLIFRALDITGAVNIIERLLP
jgi:cobalt/nickel transport system permease protein